MKFTATTCPMQSSSNKLSTLVFDCAKCKQTKANTKCVINPELTHVAEMAVQFDTMSNGKLGGFRSQLEVSYESSHTEELWYKVTVCLWMTLYIYILWYVQNRNKAYKSVFKFKLATLHVLNFSNISSTVKRILW